MFLYSSEALNQIAPKEGKVLGEQNQWSQVSIHFATKALPLHSVFAYKRLLDIIVIAKLSLMSKWDRCVTLDSLDSVISATSSPKWENSDIFFSEYPVLLSEKTFPNYTTLQLLLSKKKCLHVKQIELLVYYHTYPMYWINKTRVQQNGFVVKSMVTEISITGKNTRKFWSFKHKQKEKVQTAVTGEWNMFYFVCFDLHK